MSGSFSALRDTCIYVPKDERLQSTADVLILIKVGETELRGQSKTNQISTVDEERRAVQDHPH